MSNFRNIPTEFRGVMASAIEAEQFVYSHPMLAAVSIRRCLESWIYWIYEHDHIPIPYERTISNLMYQPEFQQLFDPEIIHRMHAIRKVGSAGSHSQFHGTNLRTADVLHALKLLHGVSYYLMGLYEKEYLPIPAFDEELIPPAHQVQLNMVRSQMQEKVQKAEEEARVLQEALKKQAEQYQKEIEAIRLQNQNHTAIPKDPDEALTRAIYIDAMLEEAGWDLSPANVKEFPVQGMPSASGDGYVDYVLWGEDGKPLAVVEAKRTHRDAKVGQHQAELYARALEQKYGQLPNIFLTNGYQIYFYDWEYPLREVYGFYNREELALNIQRRTTKQKPSTIVINEEITNRDYQQKAIKATAERLEQGYRGALLVMATGTGKTRTAASLVEVLAKANWVKRVLFLADRTALISQAQENLNRYLPDFPSVNLVKEKENTNSRIVFSTYQTLINLIDEVKTEEKGRLYGVGHFDLIIFDEIHRSVYNKYKAIFDYFDGIKVGLTATPKETTDKNTYELFGLSFGNPTYYYELDEAVSDGYLVPYKSYSVQTKFQRDGIKYAELSEEDKREYEEKFCDPVTGEIPDEVEASALDQWLYNGNTADIILQTLMEKGIRVNDGDSIGKTIIFCKNRKHADFISERFEVNYPQYKGQFLKVIDYKTEYKDDVLNDFKQKDKMPQIACSVDMLDTGIDVPEVVNLVFLKPVKSSIKFNQMIGRGTRLCKDLFGYEQDKKEFLILDFCQNFEFFSENPKGMEAVPQPSLNEKIFNLRLSLSQLLLAQGEEETRELGSALVDVLHQQNILLYTLERDSFIVRPHLKVVEKYQEREAWDMLDKDALREMQDSIAPIIIDTDKDTPAKVFDLLMYLLLSYKIECNPKMNLCITKVKSYAEKLQKQTSIPQVKEKLGFLQEVCTEEYWEAATPKVLEKLRQEMRELIKFLEKKDLPIIKTDIEDNIIKIDEVSPLSSSFDREAYEKKIKQFIIENSSDLTIDKLRKNIKVTDVDIKRLEEMLLAQGTEESRELFDKILEGRSLGVFIRSVVGMDRDELKKAFAKVSNYSGFNIKQMEFIDVIIDSVAKNGILELNNLSENPQLQNVYSGSIIELFGMEAAKDIVSVLKEIKDNSVA